MEALKEATAAQPQGKAPKEIAAEAQDDSTASLQADTRTELKQALKAAEKATTLRDKAAADMFQLYANLLFVFSSDIFRFPRDQHWLGIYIS